MGSREVTEGRDNEHDFVLSWLSTLDTPSPDFPESRRQPKRRKINNTKSDSIRRQQHHRIPTPSHSSSASYIPTESISYKHKDTPQVMPRKRKSSAIEDVPDIAHSDDEEGAAADNTPKASSRGWKKKGTSLSRGSSQSFASSSVASGASSPTKQIRFASIQETGFTPLDFAPNIHRLPPSLRSLRNQLVKVQHGEDLLPLILRPDVEQLGEFPRYAFYDPSTESNERRIPPISLVHRIVTRAAECNTDQESESSWNHHIHGRLLDFAFPDADNAFLESRYCTSAQIIHEYRPRDTPSKSVDFCVCIKPPKSSTEANIIQNSIKNRPGISINHTDWGNLCKHPIGLSIETKRQGEWDKAFLQIGTWHSAQWRALQFNDEVKSIECLPGIIVQGHSWYFVASTLEDGRSKLYHELEIGNTRDHFAVYKLLRSLECLGSWIKDTYWPAFQTDMLEAPGIRIQP